MGIFCNNGCVSGGSIRLLLCFIWFVCSATSGDKNEEHILAMRANGGYRSLADAMSEFTDPKFQNDNNVQGLLKIFRTNCPMYFGKYGDRHISSRHIFVAVEGTHRITRNAVAKQLTEKLSGKHVFCPPHFMTQSRFNYNQSGPMKRAFFMLGVYATAHAVRDMLPSFPVVVTGYYVDQLSFSLAATFPELPDRSSGLYTWPRDLLKPDITFLINAPSEVTRQSIEPESFRGKIVQVYRNWQQPPPVVEVNETNVYSGIVTIMERAIRNKLGYEGKPKYVAPDEEINYCYYSDTFAALNKQ